MLATQASPWRSPPRDSAVLSIAADAAGVTDPLSFVHAGIATTRSRGKLTTAMFVWSALMWTRRFVSLLPTPELAFRFAGSSKPVPWPSRVSVATRSMFTSPDCAVSAGAALATFPPGIARDTVGAAWLSTCQLAIAATEPLLTSATAATAATSCAPTTSGLRRRSRPCRTAPPVMVEVSCRGVVSSPMSLIMPVAR